MNPSPTAEELKDLLAGKISPEREVEISKALENSPELSALLDELAGAEAFYSEYNPASFSGREDIYLPSPRFDPEFTRPGGRMGRFEILEVLGEGGTGIVLKAIDTDLDRTVALKVLSPALRSNPESVRRFRKEASAVAAIDHAHVLPIYDICEEDDVLFFVTRCVEGETLAERLKRNPDGLPQDEVAEIGKAVSLALQAAHSVDIVHRDVKPSNILLESDGKIWLTDFGLADPGTNMFAGTPGYLSPEQKKGALVSKSTDLFSLGAVLYHMLTGRPPFRGDEIQQILWQISHLEVKKVDRARSAVSPWLRNLTLQLLQKDPGDRPESIAAVVRVFDRNHRSTKERKSRRLVLTLVFSAITLLFLCGLAFYQSHKTYLNAHPYMLEDGSRYRTLIDAAQQNPPGKVIEIHNNGPLPLLPQTWQKPVVLKAAEGASPVFKSKSNSGPVWTVRDNFEIDGLSFHYFPKTKGREILIHAKAGKLVVRNTRFFMPRFPDEKIDQGHPRTLLNVTEVEETVIENCEVNAIQASFVSAAMWESEPGKSIHLKDNTLITRSLLQLQFPPRAVNAAQIVLTNNLVYGNNIVVFRPLGARTVAKLSPVSISASGNLLLGSGGILYTTGYLAPGLQENLHWDGERNFYSSRYPVNIQARETRGIEFPTTLNAWRDFHNSSESNSVLTRELIYKLDTNAPSTESLFESIIQSPAPEAGEFLDLNPDFRERLRTVKDERT